MSISLERVTRGFEGKTVLKDFSCRFPERGVAAVMGPSGSGKSTLINLLLGLLEPEGGRIMGTDNLRFSAVFQEDRLLDGLTPMDNLRLTTGRSAAENRAALLELGLNPDERGAARLMSGGMKRRLALARGALLEAEVLLLDEPFRGLDEDTRARAADFLRKRWADRLMVLVTHDPEEARLMGAKEIIRMGGMDGE